MKQGENLGKDYYTFGMIMLGRQIPSSEYRFGFNGQEKTDEISGNGNHTTAEYWEYDTRLGRRWNLDPVKKPWQSDYACLALWLCFSVPANNRQSLTTPN